MTHGQLPPPHERPWRHPSELPPPRHEPPSRSGRLLIAMTATVGLVAVGALAARMTPGDGGNEVEQIVAPAASTAPVATGGSSTTGPGVFGTTDLAVDGNAQAINRTLDSIVSFAGSDGGAEVTSAEVTSFVDAPVASSEPPPAPAGSTAPMVVTPIDPAGYGLTTAAGLDGRAGPVDAILPSGDHVSAEALSSSGGIVIVLIAGETSDEGAHLTDDTDNAVGPFTVVVDGSEFEVDGEGLTSLTVPEGAPIFDAEGNLVGLCTIGPDGSVEMVPVTSIPDIVLEPSTEPGGPIASVAPAPTSEPVDTATVPAPVTGTDSTAPSGAGSTAPAGATSEPDPESSAVVDSAVDDSSATDSSAVEDSAVEATDSAGSVPESSEPATT